VAQVVNTFYIRKNCSSVVRQCVSLTLCVTCTYRGQHSQQMKLKEDTILDLENKIKHLRDELHEERDKYNSKVQNIV